MKLRRVWVGVVSGALMVTAAACGGGTAEGVAANLTKSDFAAELSAATAQQKSVHLEATVSFQGQEMTLSGDIAGAPTKQLADLEAQVAMQVAGQPALEMRIVDGTVYLRSDNLPTESGKPWGRVDVSDPTSPMAGLYKQLMTYTNPADHVEMFRAVTSLENKGQDSVDGVATTHYLVTVDLGKALKLTGLYEDMGPKADGIVSALPDDVSYDVWVATDTALMVRLSLDLLGADVDVHFSDWGQQVSVEAPPASQVSDLDF